MRPDRQPQRRPRPPPAHAGVRGVRGDGAPPPPPILESQGALLCARQTPAFQRTMQVYCSVEFTIEVIIMAATAT